MKISIENSPDRIELIKAMGSKDKLKAAEAQEAFAAFIAPVAQEVINNASTSSLFFKTIEYNEDGNASIPLDLWFDEAAGYVTVWSQGMAGGLPSSQVEGLKELKVSTYTLDTAVSFLKRYARLGRLDVVAKAVERMVQELSIKREKNTWAVALKALAEGLTKTLRHTVTTSAAGAMTVADLSALITRARRISSSFANGTPDPAPGLGITDLFVSPEVKGLIRNFAYEPMNSTGSLSTGPVPLPDAVREEIFRSAGASEIFGITIFDLIELGVNQRYNQLFQAYAAAGIAHSSANFAAATHTINIGVDMTRDGCFRPVEVNSDTGGQVSVQVDDQFAARADKAGFYAGIDEGAICVDARVLTGIIS